MVFLPNIFLETAVGIHEGDVHVVAVSYLKISLLLSFRGFTSRDGLTVVPPLLTFLSYRNDNFFVDTLFCRKDVNFSTTARNMVHPWSRKCTFRVLCRF